VWRLDRLGRSSRHLTELVEDLEDSGVAFRSLTEGLDTSTSTGKLIFQIFAAMAEFERNLIVERTNAGFKVARARGRKGGRVRKFTERQEKVARKMYASGDYTVQEIASTLHVSRGTIYNYVGDLVNRKPGDELADAA
jgi:DNA invertase Pin-like site-specific DNA recombinase